MTPSLSLPDEVLIAILGLVDIRVLVRCRQLCQFLKDLIDTDVTLRYRLALVLCNMQDGRPGPKTSAERLDALRKQQLAWSTLDYADVDYTIEVEGGGYWEMEGNVLAQQAASNILEFCPLGSTFRGIPKRTRWQTMLAFAIEDFTMDPEQDVIIALGPAVVYPTYVMTSIHILSMETGESHPEAAEPLLSIRSDTTPSPRAYFLRIRGAHTGVLYLDQLGESEVRIWNWRTGELCLYLSHRQMSTFAFISDCYIMLGFRSVGHDDGAPQEGALEPSIGLFQFVDEEGQPLSTDGITPAQCRVGSLGLPLVQPDMAIESLTLQENSLPYRSHHSTASGMFVMSSEDRLLVLQMTITGRSETERGCLATLCIPYYTFQKHIDHMITPSNRQLHIPWAEWGPSGTHLSSSIADQTWMCTAYGSRFITSERHRIYGDEDVPGRYNLSLILRDFGQLGVRRGLVHGDYFQDSNTNTHWTYTNTAADVNHDISRCFLDDVSTHLPFRWTNKILKNYYFDFADSQSVMLTEDAILVVNEDDWDARHIVVLQF